MFSLNPHKNKVLGITFVLVLCLTVLTVSSISTPFSVDVAAGSKEADSLSTPYCNGAPCGWAWMSGNKTAIEYGVYGTKGVPDVANYPGARCKSLSWTDTNGSLWLFGGGGFAESDFGYLNDLWRFNITSKEWVWISGNKNAGEHGIYGTKGVPDMANYPGARSESVSWNDTDGNLWLFGGVGFAELGGIGFLNDLWRFNITSKEWVWMSGNKTIQEFGVYGTKGVPDVANYPGARIDSVSWADTDGNFWLFGGGGYAELDSGALNDLWRFNITSKEWAWMSGNKTADENGVYGTKGIPDIANYPGARAFLVSWTDLDGDLWLFGGQGYAESGGTGQLNDLWRFNITSKEWAWMSGKNILDQNGKYGTKGVPDMKNYPGARHNPVSWTDTNGSLWLFGGDGYPESGNLGWLNDLWRFNITSKEWAWMSGDKTRNEYGVYGTKGVPDCANYPGARESSVSWTDTNGSLWLFGGNGYPESGLDGYLNDLWRFKPGCIEESQPGGQIPSIDDDDDDDGEQAIPVGNFYLLFIVVGIVGGVMYYKKKHSIMKDR